MTASRPHVSGSAGPPTPQHTRWRGHTLPLPGCIEHFTGLRVSIISSAQGSGSKILGAPKGLTSFRLLSQQSWVSHQPQAHQCWGKTPLEQLLGGARTGTPSPNTHTQCCVVRTSWRWSVRAASLALLVPISVRSQKHSTQRDLGGGTDKAPLSLLRCRPPANVHVRLHCPHAAGENTEV